MRIETLPGPGAILNGHALRTMVAKSISTVETVANMTPGNRTDTADDLRRFFEFAAESLHKHCKSMAPAALEASEKASGTPTPTKKK